MHGAHEARAAVMVLVAAVMFKAADAGRARVFHLMRQSHEATPLVDVEMIHATTRRTEAGAPKKA